MEYLLVMSLSGTLISTVCLLLRYLLKNKISARSFDLLERVAVLYYLVPLPFLKTWYLTLARFLRSKSAIGISRVPLGLRNHIVYVEGDLHANVYAVLQTTVAALWLLGTALLMAKRIAEYMQMVRQAAVYADLTMTHEQKAFLESWKRRYGIRRRVYLYETPAQEHTMTFGFFHPVIVCGREVPGREAELLVRHELVHIKRMDAMWKMALELAVTLHWWNPLTWALRRDFGKVCECSCDEIAMAGEGDEVVKEYLRLMIEEAREKKPKTVSPRWEAGFGDNAQKIKERIENLMMKKRWSRFAATALVAALTLANSMTVFAYKDTFHEEMTQDISKESIDITMQNDTVTFVSEEMGVEGMQEFKEAEVPEYLQKILYDGQFVDEDGNIYPIPKDDSIEPHCSHTFVNGTLFDHTKTSDGGCIMREYKAQRCSKCGYVIRGDLISTITYVTCPH